MRLFLNAVFDLKQSYYTVLSKAMEIIEANRWTNEHVLFHFRDINDARAEAQTTHAKICKAFPVFASYWKSDYEETIKYYLNPLKPHQVSFFTNFPGINRGAVTFCPQDNRINNQAVLQICEKIPRPYSLYNATVILDGVSWYGEKPKSPAWDWREMGEDCKPGTLREASGELVFYQSDCVLLHKRFDMKPELILRIELTTGHGKEEADKIVESFAQVMGEPDQKYVCSVPAYEEKELYLERQTQIRSLYEGWYQGLEKELSGIDCSRKKPDRKSLQKHFLERNGFKRHDRRRWDDHGWCRRLPHNIWLYIELPESENMVHLDLLCYGITFMLRDRISFSALDDSCNSANREAAYMKFDLFLEKFVEEAAPKLAAVYLDDTDDFYQESVPYRCYQNARINMSRCCIGGVPLM